MIDRVITTKIEIDLVGPIPAITTRFELEDSKTGVRFPVDAPTHHGRSKTLEKARELIVAIQRELDELVLGRKSADTPPASPSPSPTKLTW